MAEFSGYKLIWDVRGPTPFEIHSENPWQNPVASVGDRAYFIPDYQSDVIREYRSTTKEWQTLPPCGVTLCSLANVGGKLTTVGGVRDRKNIPDLISWDDASKSWKSYYPPMPTPLAYPVVATTADHLIAVGRTGLLVEDNFVHVMDTNTRQWSTVASLPKRKHKASAAVCNGVVYVACANQLMNPPSTYHCSLDILLQSTPEQEVWQVIDHRLFYLCDPYLVNVNDELLAVMKRNDFNGTQTAMYMYDEAKNWLKVKSNFMPDPHISRQFWSQPVALSGGKVVVITIREISRHRRITEIVVGKLLRDSAAVSGVLAPGGGGAMGGSVGVAMGGPWGSSGGGVVPGGGGPSQEGAGQRRGQQMSVLSPAIEDGHPSQRIFRQHPARTSAPQLEKSDLGSVLRVLHDAKLTSKWREIGQTLTVSDGDLDSFRGDDSMCLLLMVVTWLQGQKRDPDPPSWKMLVSAVADPHGGGKAREGSIIAAMFKVEGEPFKFVPATKHTKGTPPIPLLDDFSGSQFVYDSIDSATDDLSRKLSDVAHRWIHTGVLLGVEWAWLVSLRERRVTAQQSLRETLRHWLDSLGEVTLPRLVEAIEHSAGGNNSRLAEAMKSPKLADECSPSSQVDQEQVNGAAQGTRKRERKQSTEGEEEIDGERPLKLVTARQVALRTGEDRVNRSSEEKEGGVEADCGEQRRLMSPLEACASGMTEHGCSVSSQTTPVDQEQVNGAAQGGTSKGVGQPLAYQNVHPDLGQRPVQRLAGEPYPVQEPRPVQEPTSLQGRPYPLHSAAHNTDQAFGNQESVELTVFQEKRSIIHRGILYNVQDIASRAFARHLLPDRVFRDITGLNQFTADQRTDLLLSEVESRISVQAEALTQFLDVLNESDACYIPLVRTITEAFDAARAGRAAVSLPPAEQQH